MVTNSPANIPTGTANTVLQGGGVGSASVFSTATYPATTTANQLLVSTATNVVGGLTAGTTGQVLTGVTGAVPAFSATPTLTSVTFGSGSALSSFEQGTFNPTVQGSATAGTIGAYSTQIGRYQKVGRIASVTIQVAWTTIGTATGAVQCFNLPFTVVNSAGSSTPSFATGGGGQPITVAATAVAFAIPLVNTTTANINYCLSGTNNAGTITASNGFTTLLNYETT